MRKFKVSCKFNTAEEVKTTVECLIEYGYTKVEDDLSCYIPEQHIDTITIMDGKYALLSDSFALFNMLIGPAILSNIKYVQYQVDRDTFDTIAFNYRPGYVPIFVKSDEIAYISEENYNLHPTKYDKIDVQELINIVQGKEKYKYLGEWVTPDPNTAEMMKCSESKYNSNEYNTIGCGDEPVKGQSTWHSSEACRDIFDQMEYGTILYSPLIGEVHFLDICDDDTVAVTTGVGDEEIYFDTTGRFCINGENAPLSSPCMLFPSRENCSWDGWIIKDSTVEEDEVELKDGDIVIGYRQDATLIGKLTKGGIEVGGIIFQCDSIELYNPELDLF